MKAHILGIFVALLLALVIFQGASQAMSVDAREPVNLEGKLIYSSSGRVSSLAVHGDLAAWMVWRDTPDIIGYRSGSIVNFAVTEKDEEEPAVGSIVVWVEYDNTTDSYALMSDSGVIYRSSSSISLPDVDGSNVVFMEDTKLMVYYSGSLKVLDEDTGHVGVAPHISGDHVVYGNYIYTVSTGEKRFFKGSSFESVASDISGDWILVSGKNNFGKGAYVEVMNIKTDEYAKPFDSTVGYYTYFTTVSIDGSYAVWCIDGVAYIYDLYTGNLMTYVQPGFGMDGMVVGGGKLLWSVYDSYNDTYRIYMADVPAGPSEYIEVTLYVYVGHGETGPKLLVKDSQGNRLGYDSSYNEFNEIPNGEIIRGGSPFLYRLFGSSYRYYVLGGDAEARYTLKIRHYTVTRGDSYVQVLADNITIKANEMHRYVVDWVKLSHSEDGAVEISIDTNGDGNYDKTVETSSGNINQETIESGGSSGFFEINLGGTMCLAIVAIVVILVIVLIVTRKKR